MTAHPFTLHEAIAARALGAPDQPAIVFDGRTWSYRELAEISSRLRAWLEAQGVVAGARVVFAVEHKVLQIAGVVACMALGAIAVPASGSASQVEAVVADCDPGVVVADRSLALAGRAHPATDVALAVGLEAGPVSDGSRVSDGTEPGQLLRRCTDEELGLLLYTSGTTSGKPRGVMLSYGVLARTATYMNAVLDMDASVVEHVMAPIHHAFGLGRCRAVLHAGGTLVLVSGEFNPARALLCVQRHGANALSGVSPMFALLATRFRQLAAPLAAQVRWIEVGSVTLTRTHARALGELFDGARMVFNYGLTEAMRSTFLDLRDDDADDGCVGFPAPGVEMRAVMPGGCTAPAGELGSLEVRGANLALGYWQRSREWKARMHDGWFATGDLGHIDASGRVHYFGRADEVLNVGGEKVSPSSVEQALRELMPDCVLAIGGMPDPDGLLGQVPVAYVEGAEETLPESRVFANLPAHWRPRRVVAVAVLPRTANGKVIRSQLPQLRDDRD